MAVSDLRRPASGFAGLEASSYSAFGLRIRSDVPLPLPAVEAHPAVDLRIELADPDERPMPDGVLVAETMCEAGCHPGQVISWVRRGPAGAWIWSRETGFYHVPPDAQRVRVYPDADADPRAIALVLLGQVAIFVLHQRGFPSLHASAVLVDGGAVAFLAPPGTGKSTMASCFLRQGATLLTDDVLPLEARPDGIYGWPGAPMMKVWQETATNTLGIQMELPELTASVAKKMLQLEGRYRFAPAPAPLRAVYLLAQTTSGEASDGPACIRRLEQREALRLLLAQSPRLEMLHPAEAARVLPLYARLLASVPVRALVTSGFEHHDTVRRAILADLETSR